MTQEYTNVNYGPLTMNVMPMPEEMAREMKHPRYVTYTIRVEQPGQPPLISRFGVDGQGRQPIISVDFRSHDYQGQPYVGMPDQEGEIAIYVRDDEALKKVSVIEFTFEEDEGCDFESLRDIGDQKRRISELDERDYCIKALPGCEEEYRRLNNEWVDRNYAAHVPFMTLHVFKNRKNSGYNQEFVESTDPIPAPSSIIFGSTTISLIAK